MMKFSKQKNRGFTLVETLVAVSIFSLSVLALMAVLSQGISDTEYAKKKIIGTFLAQEGIEFLRNMRDNHILYSQSTSNNWTQFKARLAPCNVGSECGFNTALSTTDPNFVFTCTSNPENCKVYISNGVYNTNLVGTDSGFTRKISATTVSANELKVISTVSWMQRSGLYSMSFSDDLFNWTE